MSPFYISIPETQANIFKYYFFLSSCFSHIKMIYYSYKKEGFEQVMVMFGKQKARLHGYESYGRIIKIEDGFYLYRGLPSKYVTVEYHVNQQRYEVRQLIYSILPAHEKKLKLQERLRIKISEDNPKNAYVSEFDEPQYKLWYYVDKANK